MNLIETIDFKYLEDDRGSLVIEENICLPFEIKEFTIFWHKNWYL